MATTFEAAADNIKHKIDDAAAYFRDKQARDVWSDVEEQVKAYPVAALIGAVVVGFAAGRLLRRG